MGKGKAGGWEGGAVLRERGRGVAHGARAWVTHSHAREHHVYVRACGLLDQRFCQGRGLSPAREVRNNFVL